MKRISRRLKPVYLLFVCLIAICVWAYPKISHLLPESLQQESRIESGEFIAATIDRVVDGDTVIVIKDGERTTIRMIGVNTPESVHNDASKNTPEGSVASDFTKTKLHEGTTVFLEYDVEKQDRYGRDLAYIWLDVPSDPLTFEAFKELNYGAILLQNTYCESVYYAPNGKYRSWYDELEKDYSLSSRSTKARSWCYSQDRVLSLRHI